MLLPALSDGQSAWVVDAKLTSPAWFNAMPKPEKDLPFPEIAYVRGVTDGALLRKAGAEYMAVTDEFTQLMQKSVDGNFPSVPAPQSAKVNGGEMFFWPVPPELGLDKRIKPNIGVSNNVLTFSLSQEHAARLMTATPFREGLLKTDRPLSAATYLNWAGAVDATGAWVEYAIRHPPIGGLRPPDAVESDVKQLRDVMDVLKVVRSYSSISYLEHKGDGLAEVTHSEMVIQD